VLGDVLRRRTLDETATAALPSAHAPTRAVGRRIAAEPHAMAAWWAPGDVVLPRTDGVSDLVHAGATRKILVAPANVADAAQKLVGAARDLGGRDTGTAVAARNVG
jgi:serine/threonine protein phosphatase PrpC